MARQLIDLTGKRFGSWLVMRRYNEDYVSGDAQNRHSIPQWVCKCDCGEWGIVPGNNLRAGVSTCCHKCRDDKRTAGLRDYHRMKSYERYGGRVYGY